MTVITEAFTGTGDLSANWGGAPSGSGPLGYARVSDTCMLNGDRGRDVRWIANTFPGDQYAQVRVVTLPVADWAHGPKIKTDGERNTGYRAAFRGNRVFVQRNDGGTPVIDVNPATIAVGDVIKLTAEASGPNLLVKLFVNDAQIGGTYTDTSPPTGTYIGTGSYYESTTAAVDDFEGGDLVASATPIAFAGTVPTLNGTEGVSFSESLASYFSGTETPFAYTVQAGTLPAGLTLNSSTGVISGTPTTAGTSSGIVVRGTDATPGTADTNSFSIVIAATAENPVITSQPSSATVKRGQTATFTVAATGSGTVTYQWQRNPGGVGSWSNISGATSASYTTPATTMSGGSANDQDDYRCNVSDDDAGPVATDVVTLTVQQCVLALNAAGYEFGDGNDVDTIAVENAVAWEVAVVADELPVTATLYHSASSTTSSTGYLSDIGDDDFVFGTTYVVQARRVSDGEWITFPVAAS